MDAADQPSRPRPVHPGTGRHPNLDFAPNGPVDAGGAFVPTDSYPHRTLTGRRRRASIRSRPSNHLLVIGRPSCSSRAPRTQPATLGHRSPLVRGNFNGPYPMKIWVRGHDWAKRQAAKAGVGCTEQSHGFATCSDLAGVAGDLRPARPGNDSGVRRTVVVERDAAPHRAGPRRRLLGGAVDAAGGDLTHHGVRCTPARPGVLSRRRSRTTSRSAPPWCGQAVA